MLHTNVEIIGNNKHKENRLFRNGFLILFKSQGIYTIEVYIICLLQKMRYTVSHFL